MGSSNHNKKPAPKLPSDALGMQIHSSSSSKTTMANSISTITMNHYGSSVGFNKLAMEISHSSSNGAKSRWQLPLQVSAAAVAIRFTLQSVAIKLIHFSTGDVVHQQKASSLNCDALLMHFFVDDAGQSHQTADQHVLGSGELCSPRSHCSLTLGSELSIFREFPFFRSQSLGFAAALIRTLRKKLLVFVMFAQNVRCKCVM